MIKKIERQRIFFLSLFAAAFGLLEAVIVIYIRKIVEAAQTIDMTKIYFELANLNLLRIEQIREALTTVILLSIAILSYKELKRRIAAFFLIFGIWDIFYYIFLKLLVKWPPSLATIDCLFLIPFPWIAPVWIPLTVSLAMLLISIFLFLKGDVSS